VAGYRGRFAPSPTGLLHAGSLVAALASWLDARAHEGVWLVRIEDVDLPRCEPGADQHILRQLADCGLHPDEPPSWQSRHSAWYEQALSQLITQQAAYACRCSRKDIEQVWAARGKVKSRHQELVYPGTCRDARLAETLSTHPGQVAESRSTDTAHLDETKPVNLVRQADSRPLSWRFRVPDHSLVSWQDRRLGPGTQQVNDAVGDFVLRRADGVWSYQLAVVTDDARQGITHVVRGEDLADNTPRQRLLQSQLHWPAPQYLHTPLVLNSAGDKLSKQHGAPALDTRDPLAVLDVAARVLGLSDLSTQGARTLAEALQHWVLEWRHRWAGSLQSGAR
jgi:glutamyl-Q tRNA(Asp) synthetase